MCWGDKPPPPGRSDAPVCPPGSTKPGCPCAGAHITPETRAHSPANRARTTVGAGEEVDLTYSLGQADWAAVGAAGTLNAVAGPMVTFTAGDTAGSVTITATGGGCTATLTLTVVLPASFTMKRRVGTNLGHTHGRPDCAWFGTMMVHPDTVNFYRVRVRELNSTITLGGSYNIPAWVGLKHQGDAQTESAFFGMAGHTDAQGSEVALADNIATGDPGAASTGAAVPFTPGTHSFPIDWQWQVQGLAGIHNFPAQRQEAEIFATGRCESRKGGHTEHTLFSDATSTR
jgi:hypothetical protein